MQYFPIEIITKIYTNITFRDLLSIRSVCSKFRIVHQGIFDYLQKQNDKYPIHESVLVSKLIECINNGLYKFSNIVRKIPKISTDTNNSIYTYAQCTLAAEQGKYFGNDNWSILFKILIENKRCDILYEKIEFLLKLREVEKFEIFMCVCVNKNIELIKYLLPEIDLIKFINILKNNSFDKIWGNLMKINKELPDLRLIREPLKMSIEEKLGPREIRQNVINYIYGHPESPNSAILGDMLLKYFFLI